MLSVDGDGRPRRKRNCVSTPLRGALAMTKTKGTLLSAASMKIYITPIEEKTGSDAVRALLGHAYRAEYGGALPEIAKTPRGKPFFPDRPDVHFSLSHSRTHVLCAISAFPVGADIESPRHISRSAMRFFCSPEELLLFDPLDLWVLKESYLKLLGGTLPDIRKMRFSRDGEKITAPDETAFPRLYRVGDCRAAVSSFGEMPADSVIHVSGSDALFCSSFDCH